MNCYRQQRLTELCEAIQCDQTRAERILRYLPRLLSEQAPSNYSSKVEQLASTLGCSMAQAQAMCRRHPQLLLQAEHHQQRNWQGVLQLAVGSSTQPAGGQLKERALQAVWSKPQLLMRCVSSCLCCSHCRLCGACTAAMIMLCPSCCSVLPWPHIGPQPVLLCCWLQASR